MGYTELDMTDMCWPVCGTGMLLGTSINADSVWKTHAWLRIAYCLQAEHTFKDQVLWLGENGKLFFYQNELPYISPYPGGQGYVQEQLI